MKTETEQCCSCGTEQKHHFDLLLSLLYLVTPTCTCMYVPGEEIIHIHPYSQFELSSMAVTQNKHDSRQFILV